MLPNEYQKLASRTICPQPYVLPSNDGKPIHGMLLHGCLGIAAEGGELLTQMQKFLWYNRQLDRTNVIEETGDVLWYVAEVCTALGINMEDVMAANIRKLQERFPEKYTDYLAAEENRNRAKERNEIMELWRTTTKVDWKVEAKVDWKVEAEDNGV